MSRRLVLVAVLACLLAASLPGTVAAQTPNSIWVEKSTTNGDVSTLFRIDVYFGDDLFGTLNVQSGSGFDGFDMLPTLLPYKLQETVPSGWFLEGISCSSWSGASTWDVDLPNAQVIIHLAQDDEVDCTFTNSPVPPVGGFIEPANQVVVVSPYVALLALIAAVTMLAVAPWKRRKRSTAETSEVA